MINGIKLFANDNKKSIEASNEIKEKLIQNGFVIDNEKYDLAIAVGGDGAFLRMIKDNNFNSDIYYIGINSGTLGFLQEVKIEGIDEFITELKNNKFKIEEIGIQETTIKYDKSSSKFYSLNEMIIRDRKLKVVKLDINIDNNLLERFTGDGVLIATSLGSTAHNLSYGGSIVYSTLASLQITPIGPINSKVYKSLLNSLVIPEKKEIELVPEKDHRNLLITIDGENNLYNNVDSIITKIDNKKIQCVRLSHYNFSEKINEKLLTD